MKRLGKAFAIGLMIVLFLFDPLRADDHLTLSVSCTIPVVPGLNAPLLEEEETTAQQEETQPAQESQDYQETVVEESEGPHAIVQTFYAR
jgi:hypothetical protein